MSQKTLHPANLAEAHTSLAKLLAQLPAPILAEQIDPAGVPLPLLNGESRALPVIEQPLALLEGLGPYSPATLPASWLAAEVWSRQRLMRKAQLLRLHAACQQAGETAPVELTTADGVVAGVLLWMLRPMPGNIRTALLQRAATHWWGAFFALQGMVIADERVRLLTCVANDPRLVAALWRFNPDLAGPLAAPSLSRNDIWSGTVALHQSGAEAWLTRIILCATSNPVAAVTALALQPTAPPHLRAAWVDQLVKGHPRLAYLATRWARSTWASGWEGLRDALHDKAVSDRGLSWYHWQRDITPERIDMSLLKPDVHVLWQAELVQHSNNYGQELRRRMAQRLHPNSGDVEARLTLRWLNKRGRPA